MCNPETLNKDRAAKSHLGPEEPCDRGCDPAVPGGTTGSSRKAPFQFMTGLKVLRVKIQTQTACAFVLDITGDTCQKYACQPICIDMKYRLVHFNESHNLFSSARYSELFL